MFDSAKTSVEFLVKHVNKAPIADAGEPRVVNEGGVVSLDGSGSRDFDSRDLTYRWIAPEGIVLSSETDVQPTFLAPEVKDDTIYEIGLVVNDGLLDSIESTVEVMVKHVNKAPIADAGDSRVVNELSLIHI